MVEPPAEGIEAPRDRDGLHVLAALVAAKADILVTGDGDLLTLRARYPVQSPPKFVRRL